jgi:flagellar biogenesis protein FliO
MNLGSDAGGFGASAVESYLAEVVVTVFGVVLLAALLLVAMRRFGLGRPRGPIALAGRLALDGRRSIYLVRVGARVLVVGASEGAMTKLGELAASEIKGLALDPGAEETPRPGRTFAEVLGRAKADPFITPVEAESDPDATWSRPS